MIIFASALAMASADGPMPDVIVPADPVSDADFCEAMGVLADRLQADLPVMVDAITRTDSFHVQCSVKMVAWDKTILATTGGLEQGWRARKQAQRNATICGNAIFKSMGTRGWHFVQNLTFRDGEHMVLDSEPYA